MCSEWVIRSERLGKRYALYDAPRDRLKQFVLPKLRRLLRMPPRDYFKEFTSLSDVSFEVLRGETLGIVGRNGAGKSTLLQMLCGTLEPSDGMVSVRGRVAALLELGAGFNPEFTGRDNVYMNARLLGLTEEQILQRFDQIAEFADIGEFLDQPVKTYSSGMYVRLAFAVIAHVDADILVIDEALAVGDAYFSQKCMRFLRQFKSRGTLLFVSHDAGAVVNLCDKAIWLERGKLIRSGPAKEVMEGYLEDLYSASTPSSSGQTAVDSFDESSGHVVVAEAGLQPGDASLILEAPDAVGTAGRFGSGKAIVESVWLRDAQGVRMTWVVGGEAVAIEVVVRSRSNIRQPIIGFIVKDRLGQHLFGENSYLSHARQNLDVAAGNELHATFTFRMPVLPRGEYSVAVAVAEGSQDDHVVHDWVHEALLFQSHSPSLVTGLVGIPMQSIELSVECTD